MNSTLPIIGQAVDNFLPGQKGFLITTYLSKSFVEDPDTFDRYYQAHKEVIDGYFRQVSLREITKKKGITASPIVRVVAAFGLGAALGYGACKLLSQRKPSNP